MGFIFLLLKLLINAVALIITAGIFKNIRIDGFGAAFIASIVLGLVNTFLKPFLVLLTLPISIVTFGLFMLLINALVLKLVSLLVRGFSVHGFWTALGGALVLSIASGLLNLFLPTDRIFIVG